MYVPQDEETCEEEEVGTDCCCQSCTCTEVRDDGSNKRHQSVGDGESQKEDENEEEIGANICHKADRKVADEGVQGCKDE